MAKAEEKIKDLTQETFLGPWPAQTLESGLSIENHNGKSGLQSPSWPGSQKMPPGKLSVCGAWNSQNAGMISNNMNSLDVGKHCTASILQRFVFMICIQYFIQGISVLFECCRLGMSVFFYHDRQWLLEQNFWDELSVCHQSWVTLLINK